MFEKLWTLLISLILSLSLALANDLPKSQHPKCLEVVIDTSLYSRVLHSGKEKFKKLVKETGDLWSKLKFEKNKTLFTHVKKHSVHDIPQTREIKDVLYSIENKIKEDPKITNVTPEILNDYLKKLPNDDPKVITLAKEYEKNAVNLMKKAETDENIQIIHGTYEKNSGINENGVPKKHSVAMYYIWDSETGALVVLSQEPAKPAVVLTYYIPKPEHHGFKNNEHYFKSQITKCKVDAVQNDCIKIIESTHDQIVTGNSEAGAAQ